MTSRFEDDDQASPRATRDLFNSKSGREELKVRNVIQGYKNRAFNMEFDEIIKLQKTSVDFSWMTAHIREGDCDFRREAAVDTIAHGLILQQLGHLDEAKSSFNRLLRELGLELDGSMPHRLHDELDAETVDDALVLYFRLKPSSLGTDKCEHDLETAVETLSLKHNKAKFFWRLQTNRVVAQRYVDIQGFEQRYVELVGQEWAAATGNAMNIMLSRALLQATQARPDRCAKYLDQALHWAKQSSEAARKNLFDPGSLHSHLVTHSVLCGLRDVVAIKWRIAGCRHQGMRMRELKEIWSDIEDLRHDAHIYAKADGFRELDQIDEALFGRAGPVVRSNGFDRPKGKIEGVASRGRRLCDLCRRADTL